jgi:hypothetical protein
VEVGSRQYRVAIGLSSGAVLEEFEIAHQPDRLYETLRSSA